MTEDINQKILDTIKDSEAHEYIKKFLREMLLLELQNFEEGRWMYGKDYDRRIIYYAKKYKEE